MQRVVIGLSGGVDSSVAAYLLKEQGYEVVGLFMINWHDTTGTLEGDCPWHDDRVFAELVARRLDIPFHVVDLSEEYRRRVVDYMFAEYERGRTPNPDVLCNREIKFDVFLKEALRLGADFVATGHYCRRECVAAADGTEHYRLLAGVDGNKDQSYFLCQLSQEQLSRALFPVGGLTKPEVRRIAEEQHLATARRKDSQGICFVGKVDLPVFLQQKLAARKGNVHEIRADWPKYARTAAPDDLPALAEPWRYTVRDGKKIGEHNGAHFYTVGQRKGLGIGGRRESLFVLATDVGQNVIYVGEGDSHPGLWRQALHISPREIHWVNPARTMPAGQSARFSVRIRYRQPLQEATLFVRDQGAYILFDTPQRGITPGQFAAWYDGDELVGSGVISE
ncbi:MAG: tRNA 2-thiouridine(34) synthase MnmA [Alistipes onderdonkii]|nr:tRNA 2-thiouridine(34) synthase MnmA [Alistipes onderdonkii]